MDMNAWLEAHAIRKIECLFPDMTGTARGKSLPIETFRNLSELRFPMVGVVQSVTGDCLQELVPEVDPDMILVPDTGSLRQIPWAKEPTALLIHDCVHEDGSLVELAPRNVLKRVLARYEAIGLQPVVAPEMEFYFLAARTHADEPLSPPVGTASSEVRQPYSIETLASLEAVLDDIQRYCQQLNIQADTVLHEVGRGQVEINLLHGDALALADQTFLFKRVVKEAARQHGLACTFMAKPFAEDAGSAMHIHQSLVDAKTGRNAFSTPDGGDAPRFAHYIAGLQRYLPDAILLLAPYVNSLRRLAPYTAAPINVEWGVDNRTCGLRVPRSSAAARRVENRLPGVDANPYLAMAVTLACGLLGMQQELMPTPALTDSAYGRPFAFPRTMHEAIDRLAAADALADMLGPHFVKTYCELKTTELKAFNREVTPWEMRYLTHAV
ncbi:glutamine synthetase family protein [Leeia oryzae]|uniref:glutamine synthetase family protein n=1 Tax=Leeia oryzae TaxID=356662 RepID=UPI0003721A8A|nr:glutamine synthetase family protein [Leeia oryzae]